MLQVLIFILLFYSTLLWGQTSTRTVAPSKSKTQNDFNSPYKFQLQYLGYIDRNSVSKKSVDPGTPLLGFSLNQKNKSKYNSHFEGELLWSFSENYMYHDIPNAYIEIKPSESSTLAFGRKSHHWSIDDELWQRGVWTPRTYNEITDMKQQSFLGVYYQPYKDKKWSSQFMFSPLFLPDIGVKFEVKNNQFVVNNPNFKPPSSSLKVGSTDVSVSYDLIEDDPRHIIYHPSWVGQVGYKPVQALQINIQGGYKPMNQVVLEAPITNGLEEYGTLFHAKIKPEIYYHTLLSSDFRLNLNSKLSVGAGVTHDSPDIKKRNKKVLQKFTGDSNIYTSFINYQNPESQQQLTLSYTKLEGGDLSDRGEFGVLNDSQYPLRFNYYNAVKFQFQKKYYLYSPIKIATEWAYDFEQKVSVLELSAQIDLLRKISVSLKYTDISLMSDSYEKNKEHYWHAYLDTDSVNLGINYVF